MSPLYEKRANGFGGRERRFRSFVGHQLYGANQPDAPNLTNQGMIRKLAQPRLQARRHAADVSKNVVVLVDFERLQSHRRAYGMAAVRKAVTEYADLF